MSVPFQRRSSGRQRAGGWALRLALLAGTGGCATAPSTPTDAVTLQQTVERLRVQNAAYARQVQELENQVFILSDQLESRRAPERERQAVSAPSLPRVVLRPGAANQTEDAAEEVMVSPQDPNIELSGDALRSNARRPLLRLHGDELPVLSTRESTREVEGEAPRAREAPPVVQVVGEGTGARRPADDRAVVERYTLALQALRGGRHDEAVEGFRAFVRENPRHDHADNAQYWLGECFYDRLDYPNAVREFRRVVERYPEGNKVPDALLKVGFSHLAIGSIEAGRQALQQVVRTYPRHAAAARAQERLGELEHTAALGREGRR